MKSKRERPLPSDLAVSVLRRHIAHLSMAGGPAEFQENQQLNPMWDEYLTL